MTRNYGTHRLERSYSKKEELKTMRKDYIEQLNKTTDNKEKKDLINRINKIDKELGEIER